MRQKPRSRSLPTIFPLLAVAVVCLAPTLPAAEPIALTDSKCLFESAAANIVYPGTTPTELVQKITPNTVAMVLEAEAFRAMGTYPQYEWVASPLAYPDKYPNDNLELDHGGGVNCNISDKWALVWPGGSGDAIYKYIRISRPGTYRLWLRYQEVPDLPAPFMLQVYRHERIQASAEGTLLGEAELGTGKDAIRGLAANIIWRHLELELPEGLIRIVLRKLPDKELPAGMRAVDFVFLTNDLTYVPNSPVQLPSLETIQQRIAALDKTTESLAIWSVDPWSNVTNKSWPQRDQLTDRIELDACINEREQALVGITDLTGEMRDWTLALEAGGAAGRVIADKITLHRLSFTRARRFGWVPDALFEIADGSLPLAAYHTAWLWIEVDTRGFEAGDYSMRLTVADAGRQAAEIAVNVKVRPVVLPERWPIEAHTWIGGLPTKDEANVRELAEHGITSLTYGVVDGHGEPQGMDRDMMRKYDIRHVLGFINPPYDDKANIARVVDAFKAHGVDYSQWAVYLEDEPADGQVQSRVDKAIAIRKLDPKVRFWANPSWHKHATIYTCRQLAPHVDMWCPYIGNLDDPETLAFLKATGKPITFYKCDGFLTRNPAMCYNYFRKLPWVAFKYDIDGCGFWAATGARDDPWTDMDAPGADGDGCDPTILYPGPPGKGFVPSRNAEGFREGMEDAKYLVLLKRRLSAIEFSGLIDEMLRSSSADQVTRLRQRMLQLLVSD